ncbi:hypothetical protein Ct61P_02176 [Colletotrichum tofieldiae]|nr:hypothetical protein Ct61P_02176 [Colletotrichum tofieldiae]
MDLPLRGDLHQHIPPGDSGNYLYLNGASLWHILSEQDFKVSRVYLWLDAECPVTRRLLTEFRELVNCIPSSMAPRLTIDFPCDAEDGFWAWDEVEVETEDNGCGAVGRRSWSGWFPSLRSLRGETKV